MGSKAEVWCFNNQHEMVTIKSEQTNTNNCNDRSDNKRGDQRSGDKPLYFNKILYLYDNNKNMDTSDEQRSLLRFTNHSELGCFRIDANKKYCDSNVEPNSLALTDRNDYQQIAKRNINLKDGLNESILIEDYRDYKIKKWQYFLTWMNKSRVIANRSMETMPQFASFGGLFTSLLMTPYKVETWAILVCKHRDLIFMNKVRQNEAMQYELNTSHRSNNGSGDRQRSSNGCTDLGPYFSSKITSLITNNGSISSDESVSHQNMVLNEYEKYFSVYESTFGSHRLLLMSEVDAIDEDGSQVEIKSSKSFKYRNKLLNWFCHCVVANIDYTLIGMRDRDDCLQEFVKLKTEELPDNEMFSWNIEKCYDFVNRFLDFITDLLKDATDSDIYKIYYRKGDRIIKSTKLATNNLLPKWFLDGNCSDSQMSVN